MSLRLHVVGWVIISAMAVSTLNGILCYNLLERDGAMECCERDASGLTAAQDCCQPDRGQNVPAEMTTPNQGRNALQQAATTEPLPGAFQDQSRQGRIPIAREFPDLHPHQSPTLPLLI